MTRRPSQDRIETNPDGTIDEIVAGGVHVEQMDDNEYWMSVRTGRLTVRSFWFHSDTPIELTAGDVTRMCAECFHLTDEHERLCAKCR